MITLDLSILNQKGTPMFYSDTLALRPAFGIAGRIFIDIASPYGIYRDTGSAWVQIAGSGGGGGIGGGGTLNTIALFTPDGSNIGNSVITQSGSAVTIAGRNTVITNGNITLSHIHPALNGTVNPYGEQIAVTNTFNAGITWTALLSCFNTSSLQTNLFNGSVTYGNGSYTTNNLNLTNITFNAAGSTITSTQASGGIRAYANQILQLRIDGTNNGTYTHYANSAVYGDFASSTARFTITNRYGYLVNNLDEYSAGHTYTNRWAFYNAGINDNNFFAGRVGIGSGYVPSALYQLDVNGNSRIQSADQYQGIILQNTSNRQSAIYFQTSNVTRWGIGVDYNASGTKDFFVNDGTNSRVPFYIATDGEMRIGGTNAISNTENLRLYLNGIALFRNKGNNVKYDTYIGDGDFMNNFSFGYNANLKISGGINITGYLAGITQFRDLRIGNGKGVDIAYFEGSSASLNVGNNTMNASAVLSANSTTKGFLPPRMTTAEKNAIGTPSAGLIVYDTTLNKLALYTTAWETVTSI